MPTTFCFYGPDQGLLRLPDMYIPAPGRKGQIRECYLLIIRRQTFCGSNSWMV